PPAPCPSNSTSLPNRTKLEGLRPPPAAPATEISDVPAAVPFVIHSCLRWFASSPLNSTLLPNAKKPKGPSPPALAPATESSEVPAPVPLVTHSESPFG